MAGYPEERLGKVVIWTLPRFILFCLIVGGAFLLVFLAGIGASRDADRACVLISQAREAGGTLAVPNFCRSRLTHPDGYQPR